MNLPKQVPPPSVEPVKDVNPCIRSYVIPAAVNCILKGTTMSKGKDSKKETKTPKQEKPKVHATANSQGGKPAVSISGKRVG